MKKTLLVILIFQAITTHINAQENKSEIQLDQVELISSPRIEIKNTDNSISVLTISREEIKKSTATNVSELLQQIAGLDIRRRGAEGMQADLYIRGGSFDQTLLLIDGIKVEDPQTGHHTMNMTLPLEVIEKIEITKGSAARIYGQNAFTGAINIITKKDVENNIALKLEGGSFDQKRGGLTVQRKLENSDILFNYNRKESKGYRYNTDFKNDEFFVKSNFKIKRQNISAIGAFNERKFGANGFYASPAAIDQYEETQASIVGLSTTYKKEKLIIKPKFYWKRNQDMYVYLRQDPSVYRNLHISNKVGIEVNASTPNSLGNLGIGFDLSKVYLSSNNLGNRNRTMLNMFIEQKINFENQKIDLTPGVAITYFSDVSTSLNYQNNFFNNLFFYPGMDLGYRVDQNLKLYSNIGYTYRIPTYTDLFYSSPTTLGNENLKLEKALTKEFGLKYLKNNFNLSMSLYQRDASDIIDYVRNNETDPWQATNIRKIITDGFELNMSYKFYSGAFRSQILNIGYSNINDELLETNFAFSRYTLNSLKNQITATYVFEVNEKISSTLAYKNAERVYEENYTIIDFKTTFKLEKLTLSLILNNILDAKYSETNLVPMPGFNTLIGIKYSF
ncbi:MAG: TonB-dependent receptor [Flavobacteriaceae bacterium]|nr:TonB-dependent receptor [Flavobacteriaceae bacterium]|tara:strand:+ start:900 stop:2759 length:1860 start_codon:yes stop_codon:yes gene_type:complete